MTDKLREQLLRTPRGRIIALLRAGPQTADAVASALGLTPSAVRMQLASLERDGLVRKAGTIRVKTRPSHAYALTPEIEQLLSTAYLPLLTRLIDVFAETLPADQLQAVLRRTGKELGEELLRAVNIADDLLTRATAASTVLNAHLGALTHVEVNGHLLIRGAGCPLAVLTRKHPDVCLAVESLVSQIVGVPVRECCEREAGPRCCFEIERRGLE